MAKRQLQVGDIVRLKPDDCWLPEIRRLIGKPLQIVRFVNDEHNIQGARLARIGSKRPLRRSVLKRDTFFFDLYDMELDEFLTETQKARAAADAR